MSDELYQELTARISMTGSDRIPKLWKMLCDEDEARLLLATPATAEGLAEQLKMPRKKVEKMIGGLFSKGVLFESIKNDVVTYRMTRNFVQFHDATILWPGAQKIFLDLWQDYMDTEYPKLTGMLEEAGFPAFMRVIPVNQGVEGKSQVLPYEHVAKMIEEAKTIAVTKCTCRLTAHKCDHPLEVCMQFNRGAEYAIKRGTGRKVSKEEARKILDECEAAGLVHLSDNKAGIGHVICNCCGCCCQVMVPILKSGHRSLLSPSRYRVFMNEVECNLCGNCVERCHVGAFTLTGEGGSRKLVFEEGKCIGCGVCLVECATGAIYLKDVRPAEFIPA